MMCKVKIDLSKEEELKFAIYNIVLDKKGKEFTVDEIIQAFEQDGNKIGKISLERTIKALLDLWVDSDVVQEHLNSFSMIQ